MARLGRGQPFKPLVQPVIIASAGASVSISQSAGTLTLTGGTQVVAAISSASVTQVAGTLTLNPGTQVVAAQVSTSVTQVAGSLTLTGGTQVVAAVNIASIAQVHGTLTLTGGTQVIATVNNASIAQVAGTLTLTGGTQVASTTTNASVTQVAGTLTLTGGTQVVAAIQLGSVTQVSANLVLTGGTQAVLAGSMSTLTDPFNITSLNTGKWTQFTSGGATMSYTSGGASTVYPASTTASTDGDITSNVPYNLTGSYAAVQVLAIANSGSPTDVDNSLRLHDAGGTNQLTFLVEAGTLYAQQIVAGTQTNLHSAAYSSSTHKWWRIREQSGTIYWDTSSDGITWTNFYSVANPISVTGLYAQMAGTAYSTASSPGSFTWNNFNVLPSVAAVTQVAGTLTLTGGTQVAAGSKPVSISQSTANLILTSGTQMLVLGGGLYWFNGTLWVNKRVKVWMGSSWVVKPLKRWNGSAWVTVS